MTTVRQFHTGDVDDLVDMWRRAAPRDPVTTERFRNLVLLDANFDPAGLRVAVDGDQLVGCAYAVRRKVAMVGDDLEPHLGWIPFFYVDPSARRRGVGRAVLASALEWLCALGARQVEFSSYTPNYFLPGLDADAYPEALGLLTDLGFDTRYEAVAMDASLVDYQLPDRIRQRIAKLSDHHFGTPTAGDLVDLVRLASEHFNPDWARAIRDCLVAGTSPERIVIVRDSAGELVGWAMHEAYEGVTERFGPFGVLDSRRGTGLGEILLHLTLERMRASGAHGAWFLWTGEDSPAGHLYRKTGFTVTRRFRVMRAELATEPAP